MRDEDWDAKGMIYALAFVGSFWVFVPALQVMGYVSLLPLAAYAFKSGIMSRKDRG